MKDDIEKMILEFLAKLGEHCDSIQVMASWNEDGATQCFKLGSGNWYARQGMAQDFIKFDTAQTNAYEVGKAIKGNL